MTYKKKYKSSYLFLNSNGLVQSYSVRIFQVFGSLSLLCGWHFLLTTEQFDILLTWLWHRKACKWKCDHALVITLGAVVRLSGGCYWRLPPWASALRAQRAATLSNWKWDSKQSQTFVSSAKPARGSLINRVWHWPHEAAMHKGFSQPELRDGVLFLFHQKRSLKSESCPSTACMHSKSGQLTNKGRAGRKGQRKDIQILQKEVCDFQCLLCLNTFSSLLIPVLMLHDWLMEGWTVLLGAGPCNWQCVISCEQYYEESNLNAYFLTVKTWGYLI